MPCRLRYGWGGLAGFFALCSCASVIWRFAGEKGLSRKVLVHEALLLLLELLVAVAASKVAAIALNLCQLFCQVRRLRHLVELSRERCIGESMGKVRRVLICHASVGSGHRRAAEAIATAMAAIDTEVDVRLVDLMEPQLADPALIATYKDWYLRMVGGETILGALGGHCMAFLFDRTNSVQDPFTGGSVLQRRLTQTLLLDFLQLVLDAAPDCVVHTHFLAPEILAAMRRRHGLRIPHVTVVTDMDVHAWWYQQPTDHYFVARDFARRQLCADGVPAADVTDSGIPIMPHFQEVLQEVGGLGRQARRRRLLERMDVRLDPCVFDNDLPDGRKRPLVIQMATGRNTLAIYHGLLELETPAILVVVCGRQADVSADLWRVPVPDRHRVAILGFTRTMHELMAASDVVVTKPGGLITAEACACGLMMVLVDPYPGQEERNAANLLEEGAAVRVWDARDLPAKLDPILSASCTVGAAAACEATGTAGPVATPSGAAARGDARRLEDFRHCARRLARPGAASAVAKYVLSDAAFRRMVCGAAAEADAASATNSDSDGSMSDGQTLGSFRGSSVGSVCQMPSRRTSLLAVRGTSSVEDELFSGAQRSRCLTSPMDVSSMVHAGCEVPKSTKAKSCPGEKLCCSQ